MIMKPKIEYPTWLPKEVQSAVDDYIEGRFQYAKRYEKSFPYYWNKEDQNIKVIIPAFTNEIMKGVWDKLLAKFPEKAIELVPVLFRINHEYDFESKTVEGFEKEEGSYRNIFYQCQLLMDSLYDHNQKYDGGLLDGCYEELMPALEKLLTRSHKHLQDFIEYADHSSKKENSLLALSRKKHVKNADAIYFARRISAFFYSAFGKPLNAEVAIFLHALFGVEYDEDNIKKITKDVKRLIPKREHSAA